MESDSIQFPIKITEKLFISDIKSISNNYLALHESFSTSILYTATAFNISSE